MHVSVTLVMVMRRTGYQKGRTTIFLCIILFAYPWARKTQNFQSHYSGCYIRVVGLILLDDRTSSATSILLKIYFLISILSFFLFYLDNISVFIMFSSASML